MCVAFLFLAVLVDETRATPAFDLLKVNDRALVSAADLIYLSPAAKPPEGQPIGNGRMGTAVWTTPSTLNFQINRCDVFSVNRNARDKREGPTDYCGGCGRLTIKLGGKPFAKGETFRQHLSLYDAECTLQGDGVRVRCFVSAETDLLAIEIDDQRQEPQPLRARLSMWRPPEVRHGDHVSRYEFYENGGPFALTQRFREREHYCASAVAVRVVEGFLDVQRTETFREFVIPPMRGKRTVLVSSAASFEPHADVLRVALSLVNQLPRGRAPYSYLRKAHTQWWARFWSRTFVHLRSDDGVAQFMNGLRTLHLYYMASSSRGKLPAKWNGSLFSVEGDKRTWGSQFWVWTTEVAHHPLYTADASDLADPFFNMYVKQLPAARIAARQRWDAKGAYFLEAGPFDGPVTLPEDLAREWQDVYLGRKPCTEFSPAARAAGLFEAVLSQFADGRDCAAGRYSYVSHMPASGSDLAVQAWWRYRYTGDKEFLRTHAYPLLRDTLEFYRSIARKEEDGRYHIYGLNQHEGFWGVNDGIIDLGAIRGTAPLAIRASEILDVDAELRPKWHEFLENLTSYTMGSDPGSKALGGGYITDDVWSVGHLGEVKRGGKPGATLAWPIFTFEDWTMETQDPETDRIVRKIGKLNSGRTAIASGGRQPGNHATLIMGSRIGRGEDLPTMTASYYWGSTPLANGMSEFEGGTAQSVEILGCIATTLQEGLLQSVSPRPGEPEIISVLPAWPRSWDASFRLLARGGFLVTTSYQNGQIEFVDLQSRFGETCRLRNPWKDDCVLSSSEDAASGRALQGEIVTFATTQGHTYRLLPQATAQPQTARVIAPTRNTEPPSYSFELANGNTVGATLGRVREQ